MPYDVAASRKRVPAAMPKPGTGRTRDIELPNESGVTDPRLVARKEQPRDVKSNLIMRRALMGGRALTVPYVSRAQQRFAHTDTAKSKGFPTAEFDAASKGRMAGKPERVGKKTSMHARRSPKGRR